MSEPIPESVPTSQDRRSHRPTKKRALTPVSQQSAQVEALFAHPDREIALPSGPKPKTVAAPPEIVANVQGSSAGAGSGEFHVYKASRRREYERLRVMDEENEREVKDREWREKQESIRKAEEEKLSKNRVKREKAKARKEKAEMLKKGGMDVVSKDGGQEGNGVKRKFGAAKVEAAPSGRGEEPSANVGAEGEVAIAEGQNGGGITFVDDD